MEQNGMKPLKSSPEDGFGKQTESSPMGLPEGEKTLDDILTSGGNIVDTGFETGGKLVDQGVTALQTGLEGAEEIVDEGLDLAKSTAKNTGKFMLVVGVALMLPFVVSKFK